MEYDADKQELTQSKNSDGDQLTIINLFKEMASVFVDTYIIVCFALDQICGRYIMIKKKSLIVELHNAIKNLNMTGVLPHLHSCPEDIITTSLSRFGQMGLSTSHNYYDKQGIRTKFI